MPVCTYVVHFLLFIYCTLVSGQFAGTQTSSLLLLKDIPMRIVGQLIFDRGVTPFHLKESLATLGMDVTEVALKGCCYSPPITVEAVCRDGGGSLHDVVVLNRGAAEDEVNLGDPCRVSHKILSAVTEAIEGLCVCEGGGEFMCLYVYLHVWLFDY